MSQKISVLFLAMSVFTISCKHFKYAPTMASREGKGVSESIAKGDARSKVSPKQYTPEQEEALSFVRRHSDAGVQMDQTDQEFIDNIVDPKAGSPEEAALAVGVLKEALGNTTSENNIVETDTQSAPTGIDTKAKPKSSGSKESLEQIAETRNLDLTAALENNLLLKSNEISTLAEKALNSTNNSPEFNSSLRAVLGRRVAVWQNLENKVDVQGTTPPLVNLNSTPTDFEGEANDEVVIEDEPTGEATTQEANSKITGTPEDMAEIQTMIDDGDIEGAMKKLRQIPKSSPLYGSARSKMDQISQREVRELRAKAAQAYQNSLPVADRDLKITYLEEARRYLETALKKYGDSKERDTIKNNLSLITDELRQLKQTNKTF